MEVTVRYRIILPLASLILLASQAPARADGRWCVGLLAGESVSQQHGSALDVRALAQVDPLLGIGIETGMAYMNDQTEQHPVAFPLTQGPGGQAIASLTDGITRNRGYYLGCAVKVGNVV